MFISASKDTTAKLWDMDQLEDKKTYKTERPVNSAAISPNKDHVVLGGGQVKNLHLILLFGKDKLIKISIMICSNFNNLSQSLCFQEAMDVTTTSTKIGKFDARFFHLIFEEEFAKVYLLPLEIVNRSQRLIRFCNAISILTVVLI